MTIIEIVEEIIAQASETDKNRLWAAFVDWRERSSVSYRNAQRIPMLRRLLEAIEAETDPELFADD